MFSIQWKKVSHDLLRYRSRSLLVIAALVLGIWGIGSVITSYAILQQDLPKNFLATNPPSAIIWTDKNIISKQIEYIRRLPYIADAETRKDVRARILVGKDRWLPLQLFVVNDFNDLHVGKFQLEQGRFPTSGPEIAIERDAFNFKLIETLPGDAIEVKLPGRPIVSLKITGRIFDPGQAPSHMDHVVFGYVDKALYQSLTVDKADNEIKFTVSGNIFDKSHIQQAVSQLTDWLKRQGIAVTRVDIPPPGEHPHQWQLDSLLFLQGGFGLLAFSLSGVLIINMLNFLLARHIRQIGIMKALGARTGQVMKLYYMTVAALAMVALLFSIPLSVISGKGYAQFVARELNFNIMTEMIPFWVYVSLVLLGLMLPLLIASYPIMLGCRKTIREALSSYGVSNGTHLPWLRPLQRVVRRLTRSMQIAIGNTFRHTGRLSLTVATLALGLALFQIGMNLRASLENSLNIAATAQKFDLAVTLDGSYPVDRLTSIIATLDNIDAVEYWNGTRTTFIYRDRTESYRYQFTAVDPETGFIDYPIIAGDWLQSGNENELVINNAMLAAEPALRIGKIVQLNMNGQAVSFKVVGVFKDFGWPARAFISDAAYHRAVQATLGINSIRILARQHDLLSLQRLQQQVEASLQQHRVEVVDTLLKAKRLQVIKDHMNIIASMLLSASALALFVGSLGFISTMSINIIERTRELGIMRAIGASNQGISKLFLFEAAIIAGLSWLIGYILSIPLSYVIGDFLGYLIFEVKLDYAFSGTGYLISVGLLLILLIAASALVRQNLGAFAVHEALAYE